MLEGKQHVEKVVSLLKIAENLPCVRFSERVRRGLFNFSCSENLNSQVFL